MTKEVQVTQVMVQGTDLWRGRELRITLDNLVNGFEHVFLCDLFAARSDCVHACLGANGAQIGSCTIGAETCK